MNLKINLLLFPDKPVLESPNHRALIMTICGVAAFATGISSFFGIYYCKRRQGRSWFGNHRHVGILPQTSMKLFLVVAMLSVFCSHCITYGKRTQN